MFHSIVHDILYNILLKQFQICPHIPFFENLIPSNINPLKPLTTNTVPTSQSPSLNDLPNFAHFDSPVFIHIHHFPTQLIISQRTQTNPTITIFFRIHYILPSLFQFHFFLSIQQVYRNSPPCTKFCYYRRSEE